MNHASLFSGIGGFDLAAEWMGWENVFSCEYDPFCQTVLRHHFPSTIHYGDIRQLDGTQFRGRIDVLTGGFPCQPFSAAGQRRGTDDNRFLWPEMLRVIREVQPTWIVAENVRGILSIENGLVFERVCAEMEEAGYEVQPICIPACSVGAPHKRERIWFVGHAKHNGLLTSKDREGCPERSDNHSPRQDELRELEGSTLSRSSADNRRKRRCEGGSEAIRSEGQKPKPTDCDNKNCNPVANGEGEQCERGVCLRSCSRKSEAPAGDRDCHASNTNDKRLEGRKKSRRDCEDRKEPHDKYLGRRSSWDEPWIQAASRLCVFHDGFREWMDCCSRRTITPLNHYANAIKAFTPEEVCTLWRCVQEEEIWKPLRRLDEISQKEILLEILCRIQRGHSEEFTRKESREGETEKNLRRMWSEKLLGDSPQGRELEEQRSCKSQSPMPSMSHEIALACVESYKGFPRWRRESIKAYGNAIVPAIALRIFEAISQAENAQV